MCLLVFFWFVFALAFKVFKKENPPSLFPKQGKPANFVVVRLSLCVCVCFFFFFFSGVCVCVFVCACVF